MINIQDNLLALTKRIQASELRYHRIPGSVSLLAVSKGQPLAKIQQALASGQSCFGENYLQEALPKILALADQQLEWHFIGPIQRNKTKKIAEHFSWVHSLSDALTAQRLNDQRPLHLPPLNVCLQINISQESTKSGLDIATAATLATHCLALPRLQLRGLMTIPAKTHNSNEQRAEFAKLRQIFDYLCQQKIQLDTLSMGMTDDMDAAIAEGATIIRIGQGLFGKRS